VKERNRRGQFRATEAIAYKKKMKNHFGQFDDTSKEAYMEAALERYDFKQCQRQDGSIYGVKDSSSCSQKGAKEVKKDKGGEGGGSLTLATNRKLLSAASGGDKNAQKKYESNLDKLGTHALRDQITQNLGKAQGKSATDTGSPLDNPKELQYVITESFDRINKIRKGEGKEPMSLTSVVDSIDLQRIGIDADKANSLAKQGKSIKGAVKSSESTSKKGNVARLAPKTPEDFKRKPRLLESDDSQAT
jgi:hypothetical protein